MIIAPLKEQHKDGYIALTNSIDINKKTGIAYTSARKGDIIYGIAYKGKDFSMKDPIVTEISPDDKLVKKFFPLEEKETFINIPKKSNGLTYVIFFILAVFLFCKLRK